MWRLLMLTPLLWVLWMRISHMVLAGEIIHASDVETGVWEEYTPVWSSSGTQPALGNGTIEGWYTTIGKTVKFAITMTLGSTSTVGTGAYSWSLPLTAAARGVEYQVTADIFDLSASGSHYIAVGQIASGGSVISRTRHNQSVTAAVGAANPAVPATGDIYCFTGVYEAA